MNLCQSFVNAVQVTVGNYFNNDKIKASALYVGSGGNLVVELQNGVNVTFNNVQNGSIIPIVCVRVVSGTTANNIVALFN